MRLPVLAVVAVLALGVSGCSDEPVPYEDGSQAVPLAGLGPEIEAAGFEVVSEARPLGATAAEVVEALDTAGFDDSTTPVDAADAADGADGADLPEIGSTAGLLALAGPGGADQGAVVVLVFTSPSAAAVYAAEDPQVLPDSEGLVELIAGNLVAYAATAADADRARAALEALGGVTPSASPSATPGTPSASPSS